MNWLNKLFPKDENDNAQTDAPTETQTDGAAQFSDLQGISIGRYSDNNKSHAQILNWYLAEDRFKEKNYAAFIAAFFDYLKDQAVDNVLLQQQGTSFSFTIFQGSKKITGHCDGVSINASAPIAIMENANPAVMRRLLEMNFTLQYCHTAMDENNTFYLLFESELKDTSPSKLYYGLKELALKADAEDDILLSDFSNLKPAETGHIQVLTPKELEVKYKYFKKWIEQTMEVVNNLNPDSFTNAISYLLLDVIYRINFLIVPEGRLRTQIQEIILNYWSNKAASIFDRNIALKESVSKLLGITNEDFSVSMFKAKYTFSNATPPKAEKVREHIIRSNNEAIWFLENNLLPIALLINEYGMLYNEYIYSMPMIQTELIQLYMMILHPEFFTELGMKNDWMDSQTNKLDEIKITAAVDQIISKYQDKYLDLKWDHKSIVYDNLYEFAMHFSEQVANMNLDLKLR